MNKSDERKLVQVYRAKTDLEAQVIKSKLESYGIPSVLKTHGSPSAIPLTVDGLAEVKVMVWDNDAEEARNIVAEENYTNNEL